MSVTDPSTRFRPLRLDDLELVMAWRSNPRIYEHFREQDGPLDWGSHLQWFVERSKMRHDFMIEYRGRRIGVVSIDADGYVGVLIGEETCWGEGIASTALNWLSDQFADERDLFAEIHDGNNRSRRLFTSCGFERHDRDGEWIVYRYG